MHQSQVRGMVWWTSRAVGRVLSRAAVSGEPVTVIHLGWPLPTTSSALPACSRRAALERTLSGLAPDGVYRADLVTQAAGGLLHHRFTLAPTTCEPVRGRSVLCGTVPRVTPGGCWPPSCPSEPGPSSAVVAHRRDRPPDSSARQSSAWPTGPRSARSSEAERDVRRARRRSRAAPEV